MAVVKHLMWIRDFAPEYRREMAVSDSSQITYDSLKSSFSLKRANDGITGDWYPTSGNIWVRTGVITPAKVRTWLKIELLVAEPKDANQNQVTGVHGRLYDGDNHRYWNGSSWAVVSSSSSSWNTLQELAENIGSWDQPSLGVVARLSTSDKRLTPTVTGIKVLYTVDIPSFREDWIFDTLVSQLSAIRPATDYVVNAVDSGAEHNVALEGWDIVALEAVWDEENDPDHTSDILDAYDVSTNMVTLSASVDAGTPLYIRARYRPVVAVNTSPDYIEQASTPSISITGIQIQDMGEIGASEHVMDRFTDPPTAAILPAPRRNHISLDLGLDAPGQVDLERLTEELSTFLHNHQVLVSGATGQAATLRVMQQANNSNDPNFGEMRTSNMSIRLDNVYFWYKPVVLAGDPAYPGQGYGVKTANAAIQTGNVTRITTI